MKQFRFYFLAKKDAIDCVCFVFFRNEMQYNQFITEHRVMENQEYK